MIEYVMKHTRVTKDGKTHFSYRVVYKTRIRNFTDKENLPNTVVDFILNAREVETRYLPVVEYYGDLANKNEYFRK